MKKLILFISVFSALLISFTVILYFAIWPKPDSDEDQSIYHHTLRFTYAEPEYDEVTSYFSRKLLQHGAENITFSTEGDYLILDFEMGAGSLNFREEFCTLDFKISRSRPNTTGEPVITDEDISDAYTEYNQTDNSYSVFLVMNSNGAEELYELTKKYEGSFLTVWIDYEEAFTVEDVTPITNGVFCINGIKTELEAKDIVDIFTKPYFNLYSWGHEFVKKVSSD